MLAEQVVQEVAAVAVDAAAEAESAEAESDEAESAEAESAEAESADGRHCPDPCSLSLPLYRQGDPWSHRWSSTSVR